VGAEDPRLCRTGGGLHMRNKRLVDLRSEIQIIPFIPFTRPIIYPIIYPIIRPKI
jgi:hypothetical protein